MRVLLAGGGTAGHTSPLLATADALRRLDPDVEITCLGTPRGLENRVVPEAGYPLELIPPVPLPRRPNADLLKVPGPAARRGQGDARGLRPGPARRGRRLRRLRLDAGLPRRPPPQAAARGARAERPARPGQQGRRPDRRARRGQLPGHAAAAGGVRRAADPPDDLAARPGRAARRGAGVLRPRPRPPDAAGHRRLAGRPPAQPGRLRRRRRAGRRRRPGAARRSARRARPTPVRDRRRRTSWSTSSTGWTSPTPPPTWCVCRAGANSVTEAAAVGLPAIFVPLPIGNGEQEHNARPVVDAGGGLLRRRRRRSPPSGSPRTVPRLADRRRAAGARWARPRRRWSRATPTSSWPGSCSRSARGRR